SKHFFVEGFIVASFGAALAFALLPIAVRALAGTMPPNTPRVAEVGTSSVLFLFTLGLTAVMTFLYWIAPMARLASESPDLVLRTDNRLARRFGHATSNVLIVCEIALSVVLLVSAAMMVHRFSNLMSEDRGLETRGVLTMNVSLPFPRSRYLQ